MKTAIITVAGISARFNRNIIENEKVLKTIYYEGSCQNTLLYHLLCKCAYADRIIIVGGYRFNDLKEYCSDLEEDIRNKLVFVYNEHFEDYASGYSLYLGIKKAVEEKVDDIIFVEGDLDVDEASFQKVISSEKNVLTYNYEPIYSNKAVVLYQDEKGHYTYAFNNDHGALSIDTPFLSIMNSGQIWKFKDISILEASCDLFYKNSITGTNLRIIQDYLDNLSADVELIGIKQWTNCNTREDYHRILSVWTA